jgi:ribosomal protein uS19
LPIITRQASWLFFVSSIYVAPSTFLDSLEIKPSCRNDCACHQFYPCLLARFANVFHFHFLQDQPKKKYVHKKYTYRGIALEELLDKSGSEMMQLFNARQRRRLSRGLNVKVKNFIQKLRKTKSNLAYGEKPAVVKTHLRNQIVMPEMVGSVAGVYNGKVFNSVEIKVNSRTTTNLKFIVIYFCECFFFFVPFHNSIDVFFFSFFFC